MKKRIQINGRTIAVLLAIAAVTIVATGIATGSSASQEDILADGTVSATEYKAALEKTAECISETDGLTVDLEPDASGLYYAIRVAADTKALSSEGDALFDKCSAAHSDRVTDVWYEQNAVRGVDLPAAIGDVLSCLESQDTELAGGLPDSSAARDLSTEAAEKVYADLLGSISELPAESIVAISACVDAEGLTNYQP